MTAAPKLTWRERIAALQRLAEASQREQAALRKRWIEHHNAWNRICAQAKAAGLLPGEYALPPFPDELRGLTCGAKARGSGAPCKRKDLYANGRCKYHGGLSTGPTSEAGRQASRENGKKGGRPKGRQGRPEAHGEQPHKSQAQPRKNLTP